MVAGAEKEQPMFGRLRLVSRGGAERRQLGAARRTDGSSPHIPQSPQALMWDGKRLVAAALAHPPTWTNTLPVADPRGRAANARAVAPVPGLTPLGTNAADPASEGRGPRSTEGGRAWHSSAAPR
jgi:hypothetical protein